MDKEIYNCIHEHGWAALATLYFTTRLGFTLQLESPKKTILSRQPDSQHFSAATLKEVMKESNITPIHLIPYTDKVCCQKILNQVYVGSPRVSPDNFYTSVPYCLEGSARYAGEIIQHVHNMQNKLNCSEKLVQPVHMSVIQIQGHLP